MSYSVIEGIMYGVSPSFFDAYPAGELIYYRHAVEIAVIITERLGYPWLALGCFLVVLKAFSILRQTPKHGTLPKHPVSLSSLDRCFDRLERTGRQVSLDLLLLALSLPPILSVWAVRRMAKDSHLLEYVDARPHGTILDVLIAQTFYLYSGMVSLVALLVLSAMVITVCARAILKIHRFWRPAGR